jgi:hypothetical protein
LHTLEKKQKNPNCVYEPIKIAIQAGGPRCPSVQDLAYLRLLSKHLKNETKRTKRLPVALYGSETWSLTMREGRGMRAFESRVLRRGGLAGDWRYMQNEEFYKLYHSSDVS